MNPTLAFLLSPVYAGALAPEHLADLRNSGLTDETIRRQFIRSVPPHMIAGLLGFDRTILSALLLPFRAPAGGFMDHVRVKIFPPFVDTVGHTVKYLQPRRSAPRLYFCAATMDTVLGGADPLWLVEGEKKALAVSQLGYPAVGFCGIEGWHLRGSRELLPDFNAAKLADRIVELVPDGDWEANPRVRDGVAWLAAALRCRGARPRLVVLPHEEAA